MEKEQHEHKNFDTEAAQWDQNPGRVKLANDVADAIISKADLQADMDVLDFGCGTGLVTLRLQPYVRTVTGVDSSKGMLGVLENKVTEKGIANVTTQFVDFEKDGTINGVYDLVVSSMTLHHVPDPGALFRQLLDILKPKGGICFADLDAEDGSFHADNTGIFHFGFDRVKLKALISECGYHDVRDSTAAAVVRDAEDGTKQEFPVFLITARKG